MNYPLQLNFKIFTFAPQVRVTDSSGLLRYYVKQKLFKLKEAVGVFADADQVEKIFDIKADRIIDFSARYNFTNATGTGLGAVKRKGMKSLFRAHFEIMEEGAEAPVMTIRETNPISRFLDGLFSQLPLIGMLSGYLFHPTYSVTRTDGTEVMTMKKLPAFFEGKFAVDKVGEMSEPEETNVLLSLLMMVLLERSRG